jgi:hydrogenase nickel incorporation protein HypA/HybF
MTRSPIRNVTSGVEYIADRAYVPRHIMHELSIAVNLVEIATREAARAGSEQVLRVYVKVGALSGVVRDALEFAFDVATEGTCLEGAVLEVEDVVVVLFCPTCEAEHPLLDSYRFCCPVCDTPTAEIRAGRELEITAIEIA